MGTKPKIYNNLDPDILNQITVFIIDTLREEESKLIKVRHDRKRANIRLLLRKYREIVKHVDEAVFQAAQVDNDVKLHELIEMMGGGRHESFHLDSMRENVATARLLVDHMNRMLETYRLTCENSSREEDRRRYRVLYHMYISPEPKTPEEIAEEEYVDKSTVYRDIDAAADRLAVLFFGVYGLKFL